jgi:hypothetical protein
LSPAALEEIEQLLIFSSKHNMEVIGYLSPFHPALYDALQKDTQLTYYWRVAPALAQLFKQHNGAFLDFQDPATIGCTSPEFLDALHDSEVCTVRALIAMAQRDAMARRVFDEKKLKEFLVRRKSDWELGF